MIDFVHSSARFGRVRTSSTLRSSLDYPLAAGPLQALVQDKLRAAAAAGYGDKCCRGRLRALPVRHVRPSGVHLFPVLRVIFQRNKKGRPSSLPFLCLCGYGLFLDKLAIAHSSSRLGIAHASMALRSACSDIPACVLTSRRDLVWGGDAPTEFYKE